MEEKAALKRERLLSKPPENDNSAPVVSTGDNKPGDAAAMREALNKAATLLAVCEWPDGVNMEAVEEVKRDIDAALSAPPRNCDRCKRRRVDGTPEGVNRSAQTCKARSARPRTRSRPTERN